MLIENPSGAFRGRIWGTCDQLITARHHIFYFGGIISKVTNITPCDHAHEHPSLINNGKAGEPLFLHYSFKICNGRLFPDGHWSLDNSAFGSLDPINHSELLFHRTGAVNHSDPAFARQCNSQIRFRDCIHCRRNHRNLQRDLRG